MLKGFEAKSGGAFAGEKASGQSIRTLFCVQGYQGTPNVIDIAVPVRGETFNNFCFAVC